MRVHSHFSSAYLNLRAWQGKGIGRQLFEACKEAAQERACKILDLTVWSFNQDAIGFYEHCGMTERSRRLEYRLEE